ncbi:hypothetical protein EJK17_04595 [Lactobacillus xujianguonis]|uniref:Uncharacterized protein n=1 Tax=Lactobacillus xujianguonis TaxID=2495899 RepID=A0A437SVX7_9LACO|nr:hypothetical protein [Lactobacillus xujianguonis]RVU70987.1 hypothetical protein EJK17_04595 [Lactobacillus xujianguonis]
MQIQGYIFVGATKYGDSNPIIHRNDQGNVRAADSSELSFGTFDQDENTDQNFVLHFVHKTTTETQETTIKEIINYQYGNGPHKGAIPQHNLPSGTITNKTITYTRSRTVDKVNVHNNSTRSSWKSTDNNRSSFDTITLPNSMPSYDGNQVGLYKLDRSGITVVKSVDNSSKTSSSIPSINKKDDEVKISEINPSDYQSDGVTTIFTITVPYKLNENIHVHYIDEETGDEINHENNPNVDDSQLITEYTGKPNERRINLAPASV